MRRSLFVFALVISTPTFAAELRPFWEQQVSLARMLLLPLALEMTNRDLNGPLEWTLVLKQNPVFKITAISIPLASGESKSPRLLASFRRLRRQEWQSARFKGAFSLRRGRSGKLKLKCPAAQGFGRYALRDWLRQGEGDLINRYPELARESGLVGADFLQIPVQQFDQISPLQIYWAPSVGALNISPEVAERAERRLEFLDLSLFSRSEKILRSLKHLLETPPVCQSALTPQRSP